MNRQDPPQNPAGPYEAVDATPQRIGGWIETLEQAPGLMRTAVAGLSADQLDTRYRNWSLRQIVHHLADSHLNIYIRTKWTLTESTPLIKAYDEAAWSALPQAAAGDVDTPLDLLAALHAHWCRLLRAMTPADWSRQFHHPESDTDVRLDEALGYYAWHCRHHTAQIHWRRERLAD